MIIDKIENLKLYGMLYRPIGDVFEILERKDLNTINSKISLNDITIIPITGSPNESVDNDILEAHRNLMDIHITLEGEDKMAYACLNTESEPYKEYDNENDFLLVKSNKIKIVTIPKGYFCIVPNTFSHMALYELDAEVKKVVIKIPIY